MSIALQLLIGGAMFMVVNALLGIEAVAALALALFALELVHDLRQHRPSNG